MWHMDAQPFRGELQEFRTKLKVPAVIGAVTDREGLVAIEAIGDRSRTDTQAVTTDDLWHIGSCGKSITAVAYARLVEQGRAEWGLPITELFDDISGIDSSWAKPTIDDLLRCRAGVKANPSTPEMLASHKSKDSPVEQRTAAAEKVLGSTPKDPGRFVYSNLGYAIVGAAIDRLAGIPYEDAVNKLVLEPLGITTAGFGAPPLVRGHQPRARVAMIVAGRGKPADPQGSRPADNPPLLTPAGRMHLSVPDWAKFQRVFLNDGAPLLGPDTVEHLLHDPGDGEKGRSMSMGWASGREVGVSHAMQGSNTMWAATALMDREGGRTGLVVASEGRMSVLVGSAHLTQRLLKLAA